MRHTIALITLLLFPASLSAGFDPNAQMPTGNEDFSAFRVDSEVWGFSNDYSEMATIALEVVRDRQGKQEGEVAMLVYPIGSTTPIHNIHTLTITQAARPHLPSPMPTIEENLSMGVGHAQSLMWPRRPRKKHFAGAMTIESMWHADEIQPGICAPAIGFIMRWKGQVRYLPHERMRMQASCRFLRMTDQRTYWAKKDLGAVMVRYDYSPTDNEQSIRFPLSVAWHLGQPLRMVVKSGWPAGNKHLEQTLRSLGSLRITSDKNAGNVIYYRKGMGYLAQHLAKKLHLDVKAATGDAGDDNGWDLLVESSPLVAKEVKTPARQHAVETKSTYLDDFAP